MIGLVLRGDLNVIFMLDWICILKKKKNQGPYNLRFSVPTPC